MKFPAKRPKPTATNVVTPDNAFRKEFLEDLPKKTKNTVRGVDLALINEAIVAIGDGNATINNKAPKTREERFIVIATYFKSKRTLVNMFFEESVNVPRNNTVELKYNDQSFTFKSEEETLAV